MKKYILHLFVFAIMMSLAGKVAAQNSETRQVSGFTSVSSAGSFKVNVTMGNTESLRLEGDAAVLSEIETVVQDGNLKIGYKKDSEGKKNWTSKDAVTVYITAKTLKSAALAGSGYIHVQGTVSGEKFSAAVSGSGNITVKTDVKSFTAAIAGSGSVVASGASDNSNVSISGSGNFKGYDLKTSTTSVKSAGSGNAEVYADQKVSGAVAGSGNIRYRGNAQDVSVSKAGSGSVNKG